MIELEKAYGPVDPSWQTKLFSKWDLFVWKLEAKDDKWRKYIQRITAACEEHKRSPTFIAKKEVHKQLLKDPVHQ